MARAKKINTLNWENALSQSEKFRFYVGGLFRPCLALSIETEVCMMHRYNILIGRSRDDVKARLMIWPAKQ